MTTPDPTTPDTARKPKCSMADRYSDLRCLRPAAHRVIVGCVHEHMLPGFVCTEHIAAVRGGQLVTCARCATGPGPHECPTLGREVTREEARRLLS